MQRKIRGDKMEKIEKAIQLLEQHGQEKIAKEVKKNKNPELIEQVLKLNFSKIEECKQKIEKKEAIEKVKIEPIPYIDGQKLEKQEKEQYKVVGEEIIRKGKYAVVTMAGGQRNKTWSPWTKRYLFNRNKTKIQIFI